MKSFPFFFFPILQHISVFRLGEGLSKMVATKLMQTTASTLSSVAVGLVGVGIFTWGAANINKDEDEIE